MENGGWHHPVSRSGCHPSLDKEGSDGELGSEEIPNPVIAFSYFDPAIPAEVLVRDKKLIFLRTQYFHGRVTRYSGVWKANSKWWDRSWKTQEWDIEIENHGVYRLCKVNKDWFLVGEYD